MKFRKPARTAAPAPGPQQDDRYERTQRGLYVDSKALARLEADRAETPRQKLINRLGVALHAFRLRGAGDLMIGEDRRGRLTLGIPGKKRDSIRFNQLERVPNRADRRHGQREVLRRLRREVPAWEDDRVVWSRRPASEYRPDLAMRRMFKGIVTRRDALALMQQAQRADQRAAAARQ